MHVLQHARIHRAALVADRVHHGVVAGLRAAAQAEHMRMHQRC